MTQYQHGKHVQETKGGVKKWMFYFTLIVAGIVVYKTLDNYTNVQEGIRNLFNVLSPFIAGIMIAYILYLPCKKVEQAYKTTKKTNFVNKHARGLSIVTVYIMAVIILFIIFSYIIPILVQSLTEIIGNIPNYYNVVNSKINELPKDSLLRSKIVENVIAEINGIDYKSLLEMNRLTQYAKGAISAVKSVFNVFVSIIVSIYILGQRRNIIKGLAKISRATLTERKYNKISKYFLNGNEIFFRFLTSQILDAFIVGIILTIAMSILKVKYSILLGFMIGIFNLVPFFGAVVAVIISIIITALTGGPIQAGVTAIVIIILQQIDANIINPKIVGDSLNISQLLVIISVAVGGAYFGILGMFLAVPVVTIFKMMLDNYVEEKELEKNIIQKN